jgi:hypothetical protein
MKIDAEEKELLESVERGEWKSAGGGKRERTRYSRYVSSRTAPRITGTACGNCCGSAGFS